MPTKLKHTTVSIKAHMSSKLIHIVLLESMSSLSPMIQTTKVIIKIVVAIPTEE